MITDKSLLTIIIAIACFSEDWKVTHNESKHFNNIVLNGLARSEKLNMYNLFYSASQGSISTRYLEVK